jgi:hypothetical protein
MKQHNDYQLHGKDIALMTHIVYVLACHNQIRRYQIIHPSDVYILLHMSMMVQGLMAHCYPYVVIANNHFLLFE